MDAPFWELVIRTLTLLASAFALGTTALLWRKRQRDRHPARWLDLYLVAVLVGMTANRAFVLWVGMQPGDELFGLHYASALEPAIRAVGSSLLVLLLFGIGLFSVFHLRPRQ